MQVCKYASMQVCKYARSVVLFAWGRYASFSPPLSVLGQPDETFLCCAGMLSGALWVVGQT